MQDKKPNDRESEKSNWSFLAVGIFDGNLLTTGVIEKAAKLLKLANHDKIDALRRSLHRVEMIYRDGLNQHNKPNAEWFSHHYSDIQIHVSELLEKLRVFSGGAGSQLRWTVKKKLNLKLFGKRDSIEKILLDLHKACSVANGTTHAQNDPTPNKIERKIGRPKKQYVKLAAIELVTIWNSYSEEQFVYNFGMADGFDGAEYLLPCLQFVDVVLRGLKKDLTKDILRRALLDGKKLLGAKIAPKAS
jgi:hypothetical protein